MVRYQSDDTNQTGQYHDQVNGAYWRAGRSIWCVSAPFTTPRARALAAALRGARENANVGQRELARKLGIQHPQLSYWERGQRQPKIEDVAGILACLGVVGSERDRILDIAKHVSEHNWVTAGTPGMSPGLAGLLDCEKTATAITDWSLSVVPGLLQTSDYARAILAAGDLLSSSEIEPRVMMRLARRDVLTRRNPATLTALVGEEALREVIGSRAIMADQLRNLISLSEMPTVVLRVVPSRCGWHPGLGGPFVVYDFDDSPSIVHLEHYRSSAFLYEAKDVQEYQVAATKVREMAMTVEDSTRLITKVTQEMETTA